MVLVYTNPYPPDTTIPNKVNNRKLKKLHRKYMEFQDAYRRLSTLLFQLEKCRLDFIRFMQLIFAYHGKQFLLSSVKHTVAPCPDIIQFSRRNLKVLKASCKK
jgi:hypothetical protein